MEQWCGMQEWGAWWISAETLWQAKESVKWHSSHNGGSGVATERAIAFNGDKRWGGQNNSVLQIFAAETKFHFDPSQSWPRSTQQPIVIHWGCPDSPQGANIVCVARLLKRYNWFGWAPLSTMFGLQRNTAGLLVCPYLRLITRAKQR